ncbi:CLUMA_CG006958, isoform A [Clunio marinus]|uniref:CLUMA_CG006958, isoform A n=1 Tax=Clunio marinus TaxID=568069 RepID=A0A1J1I3I1_9DIPT|nr:CLUMA_CG006958, isoform A [Clunio marinus]
MRMKINLILPKTILLSAKSFQFNDLFAFIGSSKGFRCPTTQYYKAMGKRILLSFKSQHEFET